MDPDQKASNPSTVTNFSSLKGRENELIGRKLRIKKYFTFSWTNTHRFVQLNAGTVPARTPRSGPHDDYAGHIAPQRAVDRSRHSVDHTCVGSIVLKKFTIIKREDFVH